MEPTHTHTHTPQRTGGVSPRVERSGRKAEHRLHPVRRWICNSTSPRAFMTYTGITLILQMEDKRLVTCVPMCFPPRMLLVTSDSGVRTLASYSAFSRPYIQILLRVHSLLTGICRGFTQSYKMLLGHEYFLTLTSKYLYISYWTNFIRRTCVFLMVHSFVSVVSAYVGPVLRTT